MARLIWATPDADIVIGYCARVSNPANQDNPDVGRLIGYCAEHGHWSIFEMASMVVEIETTRDIGRQILRHRSFSFQEFSQRYAAADALPTAPLREARMQDSRNRQNSLPCDDDIARSEWERYQREVYEQANAYYRAALIRGIAKEQARALLPEGLTMSRMYVSGTMRSWVTYLQVRLDPSTQAEHRAVARDVLALLREASPIVAEVFFGGEA